MVESVNIHTALRQQVVAYLWPSIACGVRGESDAVDHCAAAHADAGCRLMINVSVVAKNLIVAVNIQAARAVGIRTAVRRCATQNR